MTDSASVRLCVAEEYSVAAVRQDSDRQKDYQNKQPIDQNSNKETM